MGHGEIPERLRVPDYREYSYEKINEFPHLVKYQQDLAREGLKDPWLRNIFWIYKENPRFVNGKRNVWRNWGAPSTAFVMACFALTGYAVVDKLFGGSKKGHGDGSDHH